MGTYNLLRASMTCPHCNAAVNVEIEMRFGDTRNMAEFVVGDRYIWVPGKTIQHGGRPENGDFVGEGYSECPRCQRDFFVEVILREDTITAVRPDPQKAGYIPSDADQPPVPPLAAEPKTARAEAGRILYNEKWDLTPTIQGLLERLSAYGAQIYSTIGGSDYTILIAHGLSPAQQEAVEALMQDIAKEVDGRLQYVDWYPHGHKFRIYPYDEESRK